MTCDFSEWMGRIRERALREVSRGPVLAGVCVCVPVRMLGLARAVLVAARTSHQADCYSIRV